MSSNIRNKLKGNEMKLFLFASAAFLYIGAFLLASPGEIMEGMNKIICSKDALITDYFALAGYGAAFFNSLLLFLRIYLKKNTKIIIIRK